MCHLCLPAATTGWRLRESVRLSFTLLLLLPLVKSFFSFFPRQNLILVAASQNSTSRARPESTQGRLGLHSCAFDPSPSCVFPEKHKMTVKPQRPSASIQRVLTQSLFTQAHNKSTILEWDKDTQRRGQRGVSRFRVLWVQLGCSSRQHNKLY